MASGYQGKILIVDLTDRTFQEEDLPVKIRKKFLGGLGGNAWLYRRFAPIGLPATAPESVIVIGAGPLVDSDLMATPKTLLTMKGALSGTILSSPTGEFGHNLKRAGYDHLVITGRADVPVYLLVSDEKVEIRTAADLWGKDIFETTDGLRQRHGSVSVAAIGPAGENQVAFAAVPPLEHDVMSVVWTMLLNVQRR
ncbi:MAG: aldehyde ferredoxin oxidoreductase N-terminal domain-containing protein [Desulfitobacteriaceae bacterium]